uniref:Uncharacterized protein n=1 Tax=Denticeps clupeoides TaxID=299321 RepID=A0AAY4ED33_9TELE
MARVALLMLCAFWLGAARAGKLLVIPADGSHWMGMKPLVEELGRKGHEVVVVIPEVSMSMGTSQHSTTLTFPVPYTKEDMMEAFDGAMDHFINRDLSTMLRKLKNYWDTMDALNWFTMLTSESLLYNKELMQKLRDYKFDALLTDPFFPVGIIVGEHLSLPSINIHTSLPCPLDFIATRNPRPNSYVPHRYTQYGSSMSLWERTVNLFRAALEPAGCSRIYANADKVASQFLQRKTTIVELASRAAVWLMFYDFAFEFPVALMPNMVLIGGLKSGKPKPLPQVMVHLDLCLTEKSLKTWWQHQRTALLIMRPLSISLCTYN